MLFLNVTVSVTVRRYGECASIFAGGGGSAEDVQRGSFATVPQAPCGWGWTPPKAIGRPFATPIILPRGGLDVFHFNDVVAIKTSNP